MVHAGAVLRERGLQLVQHCLEGSWVDLRDEVALFESLPLAEGDTVDATVDLGFDGHRVESDDGSKPLKVDGHVAFRDGDGDDRHGLVPSRGRRRRGGTTRRGSPRVEVQACAEAPSATTE